MSNSDDTWQIFILTDTDKNIPIVINKNESVSDLFKKFRAKHEVCRKETRFSLAVSNEPELQESDPRRLFEVGYLRDKCNIQLIVHVDGGGWPTQSEVEQQIRDPTKIKLLAGRITNELPDIMQLDDETPRVKMSCGHAIAPTSLALHCYTKIDDGASEIICPVPNCNAVWPFKSIIDAACLSPNETNEFERKMISNKLSAQSKEIKECPGCKTYCRRIKEKKNRIRCKKCTSRNGENFDFCWVCLNKWQKGRKAVWCGNRDCGSTTALLKSLKNCDTKTLNGVECPTRRACPECLTVIKHTEKCKHITCPNESCKNEFCFICLQHYPCETGLTGAHKPCTLASRQDSTSLRPPPPPPRSGCAIL